MMIGKLAFAAGLFVASSIGGVALGSYTIGGFRIDNRPDILADLAAAGGSSESPSTQVTIPVMDYVHVCKGCDAKLYRDEAWRYDEPGYQEASYEDYGEPEDLMPREDALPRAAQEAPAAPPVVSPAAAPVVASVVTIADSGQSGGDAGSAAQVTLAHSF